VASNERRFDKETQSWVNGESLYVSVTCWRKLALGVAASLTKGDPVMVTGRLFTRGFEVEGQKRSVTELEAFAVGPDLSRCVADVTRASRKASEDVPAEVVIDDVAGAGDAFTATEEAAVTATEEVVSGPLTPLPTQHERRQQGKADRSGMEAPQLASVGSS
jgi:single-strand DNA-binding protein